MVHEHRNQGAGSLLPPISPPSLQEQGRFSVPFTGQGRTVTAPTTRVAWPSQAAMLALAREKAAAAPSPCPPPHNQLTLPQPALRPPFHPGLLHGLSALSPNRSPSRQIPNGSFTAPEARLHLRRTTIPYRLFPATAPPFPSRVFWGAGGRGDGTGAGGALWGSGPGDKVAAPRCSFKGSHGDSNPPRPHLSLGNHWNMTLHFAVKLRVCWVPFPHPPTPFFLFSWRTVALARPTWQTGRKGFLPVPAGPGAASTLPGLTVTPQGSQPSTAQPSPRRTAAPRPAGAVLPHFPPATSEGSSARSAV